MKHKTVLFCVAFSQLITAQFSLQPYPLDFGNAWTTRDAFGRPDEKIVVTDSTTMINGINYFVYNLYAYQSAVPNPLYARIGEDGYYHYYNPYYNFEAIYFKENAIVGDQWIQQIPSHPAPIYTTVVDTSYYLIFGRSTKVYTFFVTDSILTDDEYYWSEDFGLLQYTAEDPNAGFNYFLAGCVINSIVHGDTTYSPLGLNYSDPSLNKYLLEQNFPNPFNSMTSINFFLPEKSSVELVVYDILGNRICQLLNDEMVSGNYSIIFNSSDLPSGIYIYSMKANKYCAVKKMTLIK